MTAEATATIPEAQTPEIRIVKPGIPVIEPIDVEIDIYVPMQPRRVSLGIRAIRTTKASPCIIVPEVSCDE